MPQAPRKDPNAQRAQDKESKRARGALSCAECRRLKLKCDKTVPCSSCKRRGCSAICPNGSLITGQGTRFVLADTEKLHQKIAQMSDRIRQLEDALAILQSTLTSEPHPLLQRELLKVKSSIELHSAIEGEEKDQSEQDDSEESQYIDAFGTLAIRDDGASTFYGRSAGSESLLIGELPPSPVEGDAPRHYGNDPQTPAPSRHFSPPEITSLSANFPLASSMFRPGIDLDYLISAYLPPWSEALRLSQLYLEQAPWFFGAVTRRQLEEEILPIWYTEAPKPPTALSPIAMAPSPSASTTSNGSTDRQGLSSPRGGAHDLGLLFVVFCFGSLTDMAMPPTPDNPEAEQYYQLTKACLTVEPVLERTPSVATVQTLSLMAIYEGMSSKENSIESTWALFGLATKLAQTIGLHRDCARWKLTPSEVQKRRALFWELFITDCWQSLATGRLATFSLPYVDCELPSDPDQTMSDDGNIQPSFPFWKARFGAECVSAVVQGTLTSRAPKYSIILALDRKVRDMDLPSYAQGPVPQGLGLAQTMSHFMPINYRELTLLYIHRCFFAHAISSNPLDPIKSQYAPSFLAGYRSACTIIGSVKQQFTLFPARIARFWVLWTHAFSASVMIASVATHSSKCKVAPAALLELKTACDLFESAASYGGRAVKFLPIVKRLQTKAQQVYRETNAGIPPKISNDIFKPSQVEEEKDELSIFSGKTHTVTTKSTTATAGTTRSTGSSPQASGSGNMASSSRASSDSPRQAFTDNPSFAGVHPSLVNELNVFDGHIRAQIQNAYRAGGDVFGSAMVIDPQPRVQQPPPQAVLVQQQQVVLQQQQQQHQLQFLQQIEQQREYQRMQELERLETERREIERQELERQEAARQQQIIQQQQQQETQRLHQEELRRMQSKLDQQRQEHYRQNLEAQHRHLQGQQHEQHQRQHRAPREYEPIRSGYPQPIETDHIVSAATSSSTTSIPSHALHRVSHSQSSANSHHAYQQQPQYQHIPLSSRHPSTAPSAQTSHQQHQMYVIPPSEYPHHADHSQSSSHYSSPATSYDPHTLPPSQQNSVPPTPISTHSTESYPYWPPAPVAPMVPVHHQQVYNGTAPQTYHYTPEGALKGIAAEDPRLQETWQSYMNNVGSPRHLFDD